MRQADIRGWGVLRGAGNRALINVLLRANLGQVEVYFMEV